MGFLVCFTVIASVAFLACVGLLKPFPWPTGVLRPLSWPLWQWWVYLFIDRGSRLTIFLHSASGLAGAALPSLVIFGLWNKGVLIGNRGDGWPLRRSVPATSEVPEAIRGSTGKARTKTIDEMQIQWRGVDPKDGCGSVIGEADDPRKYEGPFDPRDPSTWANGGKAPLLISDRRVTPHYLIFAGSQKFKTTAHVIPTLLTWGGPAVVFDPKEELYGMLKRARERMGHEVFSLAPGQNGFNALAWIDPSSDSLSRDIGSVVDDVMGNTPIADKKAAFFKSRSKTIVRAVLLDMMLDPRLLRSEKTLRTFRTRVAVSSADLGALLDRLATESPGAVRELAAPLKSDLDNAPEMFAGFQSSLEDDTGWLSDLSLASLVAGDAFRASVLLRGATDVFLPLDFDILKTSPGVVRCVIGSLMSAFYKGDKKFAKRALFSIDEADKVGHMNIVEKVRDTGASFGINIDMAWQSPGQLRDRWGEGGKQAWYASSTRAYAAVADLATAKEVSDSMGDRGVLAGSVSENTGTSRQGFRRGGRSKSKNVSYHWQRQKQITPEELMYEFRTDAQVVFDPGCGWPVVCGRTPAFRRDDMNDLIDWN